MLKSTLTKGLAAVVFGLMAAVVPVRQADAAMFVGTFDPAFGPAFPNLGFRGTATFDVPDFCLTGPDGFCDSPSSLTSASVTLYDLLNPDSTVQLGFDSFFPVSAFIQNGTLFAVNSPILGPEVTFSDNFLYTGNIYLQFQLLSTEGGQAPSAFIYACSASSPQCTSEQAIQSNPARLSFVPEPASAALLLLALGAAAAAGRRRPS